MSASYPRKNVKGSTIVVEDRNEYISNAMEHLNNTDVYKPLNDDISNDLKQNVIKNRSTIQKWTYEKKLGRFLPTPKPNQNT